jgi:hypothetical protein
MVLKQAEVMNKIFSESENVIDAILRLLDLMDEHYRNMSPAFLMDMKKHHSEMMKRIGVYDDPPYLKNYEEILKRGIKDGVFRKDTDPDLVNKCMSAMARISTDEDFFSHEDVMNKDVIRTFFVNYLRGISTAKGLELIRYYENKKKE